MKSKTFSTTIILILCCLFTFKSSAQWQINGTNINNTNAGKVGIGLGNNGLPVYKLHVVGDRIRLGNNLLSTAKTIDLRTDGTQLDIVANNGHLFIGSSTGNTIIQGSGRKVGIGVATPTAELHVVGAENNGITGTLKLTTGTQNMILDGNEIDAMSGGLYLQGNTNGNLNMVNGGGQVGIGTTDPSCKLHVIGNRIRLGNDLSATAKTLDLRTDGTQVDLMATNAHLFLGSSTGNTIIQGFGRRVGIGTGTPGAELHVEGSENDGTTGTVKITTGTQTLLLDGNEIDATGGGLYVQSNSNGNVSMVDGGGQVGIGNTDPTAKLDVSGNVRCFNLFTNSDRRYKTGIRTFDGALDKILAMRGTSYDFAADQLPTGYTAGKQVGFIAQEMKDVMPELVEEDAKGMMSVNYIGVIPVLVEALKEQHELMAEKETRIAVLEAQNTELQIRLDRIEAALGIADRQSTTEKAATVSMKVSPNPTSGFVTVELQNTAAAQTIFVKIVDAAGHEVASRTADSGTGNIQFNLSQFPTGMYVAQIIADGKMVSSNKVQLVK